MFYLRFLLYLKDGCTKGLEIGMKIGMKIRHLFRGGGDRLDHQPHDAVDLVLAGGHVLRDLVEAELAAHVGRLPRELGLPVGELLLPRLELAQRGRKRVLLGLRLSQTLRQLLGLPRLSGMRRILCILTHWSNYTKRSFTQMFHLEFDL